MLIQVCQDHPFIVEYRAAVERSRLENSRALDISASSVVREEAGEPVTEPSSLGQNLLLTDGTVREESENSQVRRIQILEELLTSALARIEILER